MSLFKPCLSPTARRGTCWPCCPCCLASAVVTSGLPAQQAKKGDKKPEPAKKEDKTKPEPKKEEKLIPPLLELKGHTDWINKVIYSPDGTRLATASRDHTVKVWDAAKGKDLLTLKGHGGNVKSVAYSPDGKKLRLDLRQMAQGQEAVAGRDQNLGCRLRARTANARGPQR